MWSSHCMGFLTRRLQDLVLSLLSAFPHCTDIVCMSDISTGFHSPQSQGSSFSRYLLLCLAHSRYFMIITANVRKQPNNMLISALSAFAWIFFQFILKTIRFPIFSHVIDEKVRFKVVIKFAEGYITYISNPVGCRRKYLNSVL